MALSHMAFTHIPMTDSEWKKGSADLLILALLEHEARHGYDLSRLIEQRSNGVVTFHVASLYPLLYRLEKLGWIEGRWIEKPSQRRRRCYRITPAGRDVLAAQRKEWRIFVKAMGRVAGVTYA
jgi:transcriptional regulator